MIMEKSQKTLWLILSVFVFYQDLSVYALSGYRFPSERNVTAPTEISLLTLHNHDPMFSHANDSELQDAYNTLITIKREATDNNVEEIKRLQAESYHQEICRSYQRFDGEKCVCADRCDDDAFLVGGLVCDWHGYVYPNQCAFSYMMCSGQIPETTQIASCGVCSKLKLTGSGILEEDYDLGLGIYEIDSSNKTWTATDEDGNELRLFYSEDVKSWVIGTTDEGSAVITFLQNTKHPQDSKQGGLIVMNETYTEQDPFLQLQCVEVQETNRNDTDKGKARRYVNEVSVRTSSKSERGIRRRRGLFTFLVCLIITAVATAASYTVTKIQEKKGCLFYPSVCDMKKEITEVLKPRVLKKQAQYEEIVGKEGDIQDVVMDLLRELTLLKTNMIKMKKLDDEFSDLSKKLSDDLDNLKKHYIEDVSTMKYDQWISGLKLQNAIGLIAIVYLEIPGTVYMLLNYAKFAAKTAGPIIGAVLAVIAAIGGIIVAAINERKQRDQLKKAKKDLNDADDKLTEAIKKAKSFRTSLNEYIILPLKKFTRDMVPYGKYFKRLNDYLIETFGSSVTDTSESTVSKITRDVLANIKNSYLNPLNFFLEQKLSCLISLQKELEETDAIITTIRDKISNKTFPSEIFTVCHYSHKEAADNIIPTEFKMIDFIANKVLGSTNCYWGYRLDKIRNKELTSTNYNTQPLCDSPELSEIVSLYQKHVSQNKSPSNFKNLVPHKRFVNDYQRVKFLADIVIKDKKCYYGYKLDAIRNNEIPESEVTSAKISQGLFLAIRGTTPNLQSDLLCKSANICTSQWQSYILCLVKNHNTSSEDLCYGSASC